MPLRNDIKHYRPRAEIERHILSQRTASRDQNWSLHSPFLDVVVADVRAGEAPCDSLGVRPQASISYDPREVVYVRDVIDRLVRHRHGARRVLYRRWLSEP